jgi:general secretion pathway protein I
MMRRRQSGFTLIEVVVALAVLGISLATVLQIFSGGLKNIHRIDQAHRAMAHGENVMNELLTNQDINQPTQVAGDLDEDFAYSADVMDWEVPEPLLDQGMGMETQTGPNIRLLNIHVRVHFKHDRFGKMYQLVCLKAVSEMFEPGMQGLRGDPIRQLFGGGPRTPQRR